MPPKNDDNLLPPTDPDVEDAIEASIPANDEGPELDETLLTEEERALIAADDDAPDMFDPDLEEPGTTPATPAAVITPTPAQGADTVAGSPPETPAASPPPVIPDRVDRTAELAALTERETKLEKDFADGEIADGEYAKQLKEIAKQQGVFEHEAQVHADLVKEARAAGDAAFLAAANAVKAATPELFMPDHVAAFNRHVEAVTADKRNANLTFLQQIEKAQLLYSVDIDRPDLAPVKKNAAPAPKADPTPAKPQPIRAQPVPTLARIPASAPNIDDGGRFAALDSLLAQGKIDQHERAIQKMTPEQREAYEAFEG